MKRPTKTIDAFILGGGISSFFSGLITPNYTKLILSNLDLKVLSAGSLIAALLPLITGLFFENKRLVKRLYGLLPLVMLTEVLLTVASIFLSSLDLALYYVTAMAVFGLFSSTVMYLLQVLKQKRYAGKRAAFDRRYAMADAGGYLAGSLLVFANLIPLEGVYPLLVLGFLQTLIVYLLFLACYRKPRRVVGRRAPVRSRPGGSVPARGGRTAALVERESVLQ